MKLRQNVKQGSVRFAPRIREGVFTNFRACQKFGFLVSCFLFSVQAFSAEPTDPSSDLNSSTVAIKTSTNAIGDGVLSEDFLGDDGIETDLSKAKALATFDHIATGFPLTGKHIEIDCQVCHLGGIFTELPTQCRACHNGNLSPAVNALHIPIVDDCGTCHTTIGFAIMVATFDHSLIGNATCVSCHDGIKAIGKPSDPIHQPNSTKDCVLCHNTVTWLGAGFDHTGVVSGCFSCHDGSVANTKKLLSHIPSSNICETCHEVAPGTWVPLLTGRMDHTQVVGVCSSCHNGIIATGKHALHIVTTEECNACHGVTAWTPAAVDHSTFVNNCITCHDGSIASGKSTLHFLSTDTCDACHQKFPANWKPVAASAVDHSQVLGNCSSCHDGTVATGKTVNHIVTPLECNQCHATTAWLPAAIDHTGFAGNCIDCHNGSIASGKNLTHILSADVCDACHAKLPATWAPIAATSVDHIHVSGACVSCHNNSPIAGKSTNHISTKDDCVRCHVNAQFPVWRPVPNGSVDHLQVLGLCADCHNGTIARGKGPTHIVTTLACDSCHIPSDWLAVTTVDHSTIFNGCVSCHNGTKNSGKSNLHISTSDLCEKCHQKFPARWTPVATNGVDHTEVMGSCDSCHNNAPISGKSANHPATSNNCVACHNPGPAKWLPLLVPISHTDILGTCVSCHTLGGIASPKSTNHPLTSDNCQACHGIPPTLSWLPFITPLDHAEVQGTCFSCHNGTITSGKSAAHPATSDTCDICHSVPPVPWRQFITPLDHAEVFGACVSCHTPGGVAAPKSAGHPNTTNNCQPCHRVSPSSWLPFISPLDHFEILGTCVVCHNTSGIAAPKSANHPSTTDSCAACHNVPPQSWLPFITPLDHNEVFGLCVSCHDGTVASGIPGGHPTTTNVCEACHNEPPLSWLPVIAPLDHNQVVGSCSSCHSLPGGHANTTNLCEACHSIPPTSWSTVITPLDHNQVIGSCVSCHTSGGITTPKSATHPPTSEVCDACHDVPPTAWASVFLPFTHLEATIALCTDCHATGIATPVNGGHCTPLGGDCSLCHNTASFGNTTGDCAAPPPAPGVPPPPPAPVQPAPGMGGMGMGMGMGGGM